ncbi:hypothetical protein [Methylocapsa palsarum]|uniref:Secreted protein n=1 Tax=Methylocapsa palsarum TaxID=1612308 RepID=A0A1I4ADA5_9HYPH|nr:hypothetical protein [Methylocapsa palsarum]SFK54415.1 hypothetical protein SAMN05444581_11027 [Methylocapsa palsarum]
MRKTSLFLGVMIGLAIVSVAYTETRDPANTETQAAQASETKNNGCITHEVALDEGYGVTRTEKRVVCGEN